MTNPSHVHPFEEAIKLEPETPESFKGYLPKTFANMVGPYGGAIAAVMLNSILSHPEHKGVPVSITVNFAGPIADAPFTITTKIARTNRTNQHWICELKQDDQIAVTATALFASRRETWTSTEITPPEAPPVEDVAPFSVPGFPGWIHNYDLRIVGGPPTMSGEQLEHSESILWVKEKQDRTLDFPALLAISDVFFPRIFVRRQSVVPAGTVSLTTNFHADASTLAEQGAKHMLAKARGQRFFNGYFDQVSELWSSNGTLLATSSQMVYFKE